MEFTLFQYLLTFFRCNLSSDAKTEIESHFASSHKEALNSIVMIRMFYADPSSGGADPGAGASESGAAGEDKPWAPLWSRDMPGLKHIRGILYEDSYEAAEAEKTATAAPSAVSVSNSTKKSAANQVWSLTGLKVSWQVLWKT